MRNGLICAPLLVFLLGVAPAAHAQPTLSKVFTPSSIGPGSASTATFTLTNGSGSPITDVSFTDNLPGVVTVADPPAIATDCELDVDSGSIVAPVGGNAVTVTGIELAAGSSCTITVNVTSSTPGTHTNPAVTVTSSAGASMSLPRDLTVATDRPGFTKVFNPSTVPLGGRSTLTYTIDNSANANQVFSLAFTDDFPPGLAIADPSGLTLTGCDPFGPPTVTALPGSGSLSFAGGSVAAMGTCTIRLDVVATNTARLESVTSDLTGFGFSTGSFSSGKAGAAIEVTAGSLILIKSFLDDPTPPGSSGVLEFTVLNRTRDQNATNVEFSDPFGVAGVTFDSVIANDCGGTVTGLGTDTVGLTGGTVAPEGSCTLRVEVAVDGAAVPGSYPNTTSAISGDLGGTPVVGNVASDTFFIEPTPLLTVEFLEDGTLASDPVVTPGDDVVLRYTVTNTALGSTATNITFQDELTDVGGTSGGFLPFPVVVDLPPMPDPPCGAGSSLQLISAGTGRQALLLTGGELAAGGSCTFDVTVSLPADYSPGIYTDTTGEVSAEIDGDTVVGGSGSDTLTVIAAPRLVKEFTDDPVSPGGSVTLQFTFDYPAEAPGDATDITFTDDLSAVLADLTVAGAVTPDPPCGVGSSLDVSAGDTLITLMNGALSPGETCVFSVVLDVPEDAPPGTYTNTTSGVAATVQGMAVTSVAAFDELKVAGLEFSKEFLDNPVLPGETTTLRFTIENIHPTDDATDIVFTDDLGAVISGMAAIGMPTVDTCGGTFSGTNFVIYSGGSLTTGTTCTIEVEVQVPGGAADGDYSNVTSSLSATQSGGAVSVDPAVDLLTVNANLLQLTKTFVDDPVAPGDSVTLEFLLQNLDDASSATAIAFSDDLGAALTGLTFDSVLSNTCGGIVGGTGTDQISVSGVSLAASGSCTLRVSLTVPGGTAPDVYTNTTSALSGMVDGFAVEGDPASDELEVLQLLLFTKAFDGPTVTGGTAVMTFTLTNPGADAVSGISFSDDLDAVIPGLIATDLPAVPCGDGSSVNGISFLTFTGGSLPPMGGTCSFDVTVEVPVGVDPGLYTNTTSDLTVSGLQVADPASADLEIEPPPTFAKTFLPDSILAGGTSRLTFTIDNSASVLAAGDLAFIDNLPSGVTVTIPSVTSNTCGGNLAANDGSGTISLAGGTVAAGATCTVEVDVTSISAGMYTNTTEIFTSSSGGSGTATDTLTVIPATDLSITKDDGVTTATPGETVTYTITVVNPGPSPDPSVTVSDVFPGELSCIYTSVVVGGVTGNTEMGTGDIADTLSMPVSSTVIYTADCDIDPVATGTLSNTATVVASITDTDAGNNSATDDDTILVPETDLEIEKTADPDPVIAGEDLTYTLTVTNLGPSNSLGSTVTDVLPTGTTFSGSTDCMEAGGTVTCDLGSLGVGDDQAVTFTVTVDLGLSGALDNTATVAADETDPEEANNSSTATVTVNPQPGFSKSFMPNPVAAGEPTTLTLTIDNTLSTVDATGLDFTDDLPAGLVVADPADASTTCVAGTLTAVSGSDTVSYTGGTVLAGTTCEVTVEVQSPELGFFENTTGELTSSLGNSGTASSTLEVNDLLPPTVEGVSVASEPLMACDTFRVPILSIVVDLEDGNTPILNADDPASYLLVGSGPDGDFSTASCAGGVAGDDVQVPIAGIAVSGADPLNIEVSLQLPSTEGLYRFLVCDDITDTAGNALDGDGDGTAGGDFLVAFFRADPFNLFANGHFDDCPVTLDPWVTAVTPPTTIQPGNPGADDVLGSPLSASAHVANSAGGSGTLGQCVPVAAGVPYELEASLRFDTALPGVATFSRTCDFYGGSACGGANLGTASFISLVEDEGGAWVSTVDELTTPAGAASALCGFGITEAGGDPNFDVYLDALFLGASVTIFEDGFELGDFSAWSVVVP